MTTGSRNSTSTELARSLFRDVLGPLTQEAADARLAFDPDLVNDSYFRPASRSNWDRSSNDTTALPST